MSSDGDSENSWRGVSLAEIYGSQSPWGSPEFALVSPSYNHAVMYHIPSNGTWADDRPPKPQIGHDKWDHDFVRMPYSSHSLYPVVDNKGEKHLKKRWDIIENALKKPIHSSQELAEAILSYNSMYITVWKFPALHKLFNEYLEEEESQFFFDVTLPELAKLALALPTLVQVPLPLLKQHKNRSVSLSQQQIACLLANAFFCTFPRRNSRKPESEYASYPYINFYLLYESQGSDSLMEKLKCLCHYFRRVCTKVPVGVVTYSRRSVPQASCPEWEKVDHLVASCPVHVDSETTIEDAHGLIQMDFANKFLGGGVLRRGCVQEEIRFVICPELMVSMLLTEMLNPDEALIIIGCERYSNYSGYSSSFQWTGDHQDQTPHDSSGRRRCTVLAIDALPFRGNKRQQYQKEMVIRELNKAWVGISYGTGGQSTGLQYPGVATGNWGCGAFGGNPHLKSLLQIMACTHARRPMAYYTFADTELRDDIINMYNMMARHNVTVGQLYQYIIKFSQEKMRKPQLYPFLIQLLKDEDKARIARDNPQPMDMSANSEGLLSKSLENEFLNENVSQELNFLFSEDDTECSQELIVKDKKLDEEPNRPSESSSTVTDDRNSRLFNAVKSLDEGNESANVSHTLPATKRPSLLNDSTSVDSEKSSDATGDFKKKISRKITDYFSKKSS